MKLKVLDLFSGIGGFSLAAHRAGMEVVAHCEIEAFPQAVLKYRFPNIPIFRDVKEITKENCANAKRENGNWWRKRAFMRSRFARPDNK